jgi:hypothetical protein
VIEISVQEHEDTSVLKLVAPQEQSEALLRLISTYVVEGAKAVEEDAHIQWAGLLKKEEARRLNRARTQAWIDKLKNLVRQIPHVGSAEEEPEPAAVIPPMEAKPAGSGRWRPQAVGESAGRNTGHHPARAEEARAGSAPCAGHVDHRSPRPRL